MRARKSFLLLLNLIFSTFTLLFRFLLSCHHRHKSAHNLERRAPRGRGCLKCVLNAPVFVTVLWLEWKGRTEPAEWAQTCLTRPDGIVGFKAHVLCVGMLEICPLSCPIHAILRTSLWLHSVTPAYRFFICAEDPVPYFDVGLTDLILLALEGLLTHIQLYSRHENGLLPVAASGDMNYLR